MLGSVLLIDDGELGGTLGVLQQLDVVIDHVTGAPTADDLEPPYDLVVSSVRRAPALAQALESAGAGSKPAWVAIHNQDFLPLRDRLRRAGVNYLVVDGVAPEALRLLFLHALYRGPERRGSLRLPVGSTVHWATENSRGEACLLDLTLGGCRLAGVDGVAGGAGLEIRFPSGLSAGRELRLEGRAVRFEMGVGSEGPTLAVAFDELDERTRDCLAAILEGSAIGTRVTPLSPGATASAPTGAVESEPAEAPPAPARQRPTSPTPAQSHSQREREPEPEPEADVDTEPELELSAEERRNEDRVDYTRNVTAESRGASLVLLGRDLSATGMRVAPDPHLRLGSKLRITVYGGPRQRPAVVPAEVIHDEGERGLLLRFSAMARPSREALDAIVGTKPSIEVLTDSDDSSGPVVPFESLYEDEPPDLLDDAS